MNNKVSDTQHYIKNEIRILLETGQLDDALISMDKYGYVFPEDPDIYAMKSYLFYQRGDLQEAKRVLEEAVADGYTNHDVMFNLAHLYELGGELLKAVEGYEDVLFHSNDEEEKNQLLNHLLDLEVGYTQQLLQDLHTKKKLTSNQTKNGANIHVMYDSQYCDRFIHFMADHFNLDEHLFLIVKSKHQKLEHMSLETLRILNVRTVDFEEEQNYLIYSLQTGSKVFIHYLFDYICELICKLNLQQNIYWMLWGGDLYNYIQYDLYGASTATSLKHLGFELANTIKKDTLMYYYRKAAIRKIDYILTWSRGDYENVKKNFLTSATYQYFVFPNPTDFEKLAPNRKIVSESKVITILAGNSGNPTNNHLEIMSLLSRFRNEQIQVIVPLSYGGHTKYIDYVIKKGRALLGNKFIPLLEYQSPEKYFELLNRVDVALFNHYRQQGVGNILALLYLGKKVYIHPNATTYKDFNEHGISINNITELDSASFQDMVAPAAEVERNQKKVLEWFGTDAAVLHFHESLNK